MRRRRQLARALSLATVVGVRRRLARPAWPPIRATPPTPARGPQGAPQTTKPPAGPPPIEAPKNDLSWRDCTSRVFSDAAVAAAARRHAGLRQLRRRPRPDQRRHRDREHRRGARQVGADPGRRRAAGDDHRIRPAVVGAAAGVAVPRGRRRAQDPSDRGGRPPRHGHVGRAGLPRPVRPPGDARPGAVPVRRRPRRQPRRRSRRPPPPAAPTPSRPATRPTTTRTPPRTSNGCAAPGTCPTLALLGIGNGAQVALAYAGSHPNKVARLVLDSPLPLGIAAEAATEQRVKGEQAALDAFAAQCVATNCPLGARPEGRRRRAAGRRAGRQRARRRVGGDGRRRDHDRAGLPARRPRRLRPTSLAGGAWRRPAPATPTS